MLSISDYDAAEARAIQRAPYPVIRAFRPAAFAAVNFPSRVSDERELIRYCDIMHELADQDGWYRRTPYSVVEAELIRWLAMVIGQVTGELFGQPIQPFMCLFPPIPLLRAVEALRRDRPLHVFEIGPGGGHLGAYLIARGHHYVATDCTQSLYLWQHRLFRSISDGDFFDYAAADAPLRPTPRRATLMPWWRFAELHRDPWPVDIIICDAALGEMDVFAANYVIRLAAEMLRGSPVGVMLYQNIGEPRKSTLGYIESRFRLAGFTRRKWHGVTVQALTPVQLGDDPRPLGGTDGLRYASDFLTINRTKLLDSYAFFDFMRLTDQESPAPGVWNRIIRGVRALRLRARGT